MAYGSDSNTFLKSSGSTGWNGAVYSTEGYTGGAFATARASSTSNHTMFGLSDSPSSSYSGIDYAWYLDYGSLAIYESGSHIGNFGTYTTSTVCTVTYDSYQVKYWKDGVIQRTVTVSNTNPFQFSSSTYYANSTGISNVAFGAMGPIGQQGLQGIQGTYGAQGLQGIQGTYGAQGLQGIQGAQGIQGTYGATGNQGAGGPAGPGGGTGAQGAGGPAGPGGGTGAQGAGGPAGPTGVQGATGPAGGAGGTGPQGATGAQGATGSGSTGPQGATGAQGATGSGSSGPQGATGIQGARGYQGYQGPSGGGSGGPSDYRLKENIKDFTDGYGIVKEAQSYSFSFKDDPFHVENFGFLAHELQEAAGKIRGSQDFEPVSGTKDEIDGTQGKPVYQSVDYAKMTAVLWSALRETIEKVEKVENRVKQLEDGQN
jgi:hypothetical protein